MFKRIVCCLLIIALALAIGNIGFIPAVDATDTKKEETKVFDTATKDDNFVDNRVMVVLNHEASLKFKSYSTKDFPEVACKSVRNLSTAAAEKVQAKLRGERLAEPDINAAFMNRNINTETFKTILCLELETPGKENVLKAVKALEQREDIYYVGPDYFISFDVPEESVELDASRGPVTPEDDIPSDIGWHTNAIELSDAWEITTGNSNVKIGVLDSGIDASHPELQGKVDTVLSENFAPDNVEATTDRDGHGTHVAGIIAGNGNNSFGAIGVCQNVTLVSLRVDGVGATITTLIAAIAHAYQNNIPILNISLKVITEDEADEAAVKTILESALNSYSGLAICAAGNDGHNCDMQGGIIPAILDCDNIISVGASTALNTVASFSNYGATTVDIFAPGSIIASCFPQSLCSQTGCSRPGHLGYGYHIKNGTSMAAPMVAGVAALMLSADSSLTSSEIKSMIMSNDKNYSAFSSKCVSGGQLNAKNIFSLHSMHNAYLYYVPVSSNRHQQRCDKCNTVILEPHAWDGAGGCYLCGYSH